MQNNIALLYTTVDSLEIAEKIAEEAVAGKYAACVNIIPNGRSIYIWENKIEKSTECYLLFKTSTESADKLQHWLSRRHPYTVPALLKASTESSEAFSNYINKYTQN